MFQNTSYVHPVILLGILLITVVSLVSIWTSKQVPLTSKLIWTIVVVFLPVVGAALWWVRFSMRRSWPTQA